MLTNNLPLPSKPFYYIARAVSTSLFRLAPPKGKGKSKKGDATPVTPVKKEIGADHVFNIFKNLEDHRIGSYKEYPDWVAKLCTKKPPNYAKLEMKFVYGKVKNTFNVKN